MNEWLILFGVVGGPCLLAWLTGRQRQKEAVQQKIDRAEEAQRGYDREDAVARQLLENDRAVAERAERTHIVLEQVHTLVNSAMTDRMHSELDETRRSLVLMRELVELRRDAGQKPSDATLAEIDVQVAKIAALEVEIADREAADLVAKQQAEASVPDPV